MLKGKYTYYILGIVIVAALLLKVVSFFDSQEKISPDKTDDKGGFILEGDKNPTSTPIIDKEDKPIPTNQEVILDYPQPGQAVSSPLTVSGQARGTWFFEASLPIRLLDDKGQTIAIVPAQAQGEWMTEKLVPFQAVLNFETSASSGYLVISKDNPSGLPEHDASVRISVKFSNK